MNPVTPPKWSGKLLRLFIRKEYLEEIEGDMEEVFYDDLEQISIRQARRNYTLGVIKLLRLNLIKNLEWMYQIELIGTTMRTIKLAFRNLLKFKTHSTINLVGLSLGLAVGSLILLYVMDELSYDNFHANGDRIYKVITATNDGGKMETNAQPIGYQLRTNYPEIESVLYTRRAPSSFKVNYEDERFEHDVYYASEEFFDLFSFDLKEGNPETALTAPYSVVITQYIADNYFEGDAMGQTLRMRDSVDFKVAGILADLPSNSHIQFDILISFSTLSDFGYFSYTEGWGNFDMRNYVLVREGVDVTALEGKIATIYDENVGEWFKSMGMEAKTELIPFNEIYLGDGNWNGFGPKGSEKRVKTVSIIAIFLLLLACINYINLSTARSAYRAKEVGMKKIVGATRGGIIGQFMTESLLITLIAFVVSSIMMGLALPLFNDLMLKKYALSSFLTPEFVSGVGLVLVLVAFLSGYYPALIVSGYKPLQALNGRLGSSIKGLNLRKALITFQFFISSALVLATLLVIEQINYMKTQDLGFDKEQILVVSATNVPGGNLRNVLKNELATLSGVRTVTHTNALPGRPGWQGQWAYPEKMGDNHVDTEYMAIDENYLPTLGLELLAGQNFDLTRPSELNDGLIINETCVKAMGWNSPQDAIGRRIVSPSGTPEGTVIGVVKDYHGLGLQSNIWPKAMDYSGHDYGNYYAIRYEAEQTYDLIKNIESKWNETYGSYPFNYFFLDQDFDRQYRQENQLAKVLSLFAIIVIIVSAIGLLGLISFVALSKTKEVGIRKTLGASIGQIIYMLSRDFILLVFAGNLLAIPLVWYFGNEWLEDFAYHIGISPMIFVLTLLVTTLIAFITVSFQTLKTARKNPVFALRYE